MINGPMILGTKRHFGTFYVPSAHKIMAAKVVVVIGKS